ncbi:hypothetical protein RF11_06279 [Thelohanellus kitauei]|uniref:Uncharacterized protein n=1 Tax=Thelohanellus kitauei TaxID=669202 RepID=A0A0C2MYZ0_THEKT|nr:hypothetical protein RF11_06279 [Thelohanellus kitauei]
MKKANIYIELAICYLKTMDIRSYPFLEKAIELLASNNKINKAIEHCFRYGYQFLVEGHEPEKTEIIYKRGEQLRHQHQLSHTCVITKFEVADFKDDAEKATRLAKEVSMN